MSQAKKAKVASSFDEVDDLAIKTLRVLGAELPQTANSGHPGAPIGMAPMAHVLWSRHLRFTPREPFWMSRDRFVLSNGHACALLYSLLHVSGYEPFTLEQLGRFRQPHSMTPGHPECYMEGVGAVGGVEVTTGPLGQGFANAVGMAAMESNFAARYGTELVDSYTYVFCGDGCMQEGVASEAASLAGHWRLGKLIVLYDDNAITIDGPTSLSFSERVDERFAAYGWHVQTVARGDTDLDAIDAAIRAAKAESARPSLICVKTTIGLDTALAGTAKVHGSPIGMDDLRRLKQAYGFDADQALHVPASVRALYAAAAARNHAAYEAWQATLRAATGDAARELRERLTQAATATAATAATAAATAAAAAATATKLAAALRDDKAAAKASEATRKLSGAVLERMATTRVDVVGGSADLTPSNNTRWSTATDYAAAARGGRYFRFGVREHGMSAICNGMFAYQRGATRPFCATFLNFIQYSLPAVRLSAISHFGVLYVMTHDSIGLGEDGPTHQPINALACVRAMPNAHLHRPADVDEVAACYALALAHAETPAVVCLSRQDTPKLAGSSINGALCGGYIVEEGGGVDDAPPAIQLLGTGTEVALCVAAKALLAASHPSLRVRVVSMPCLEVFAAQSATYKRSVLCASAATLSVEAAAPLGWERYSHASIAMRTFGMSGPYEAVLKEFGFTADNVAKQALGLLEHFQKLSGGVVPNLVDRYEPSTSD